jgi:hypothetical protein
MPVIGGYSNENSDLWEEFEKDIAPPKPEINDDTTPVPPFAGAIDPDASLRVALRAWKGSTEDMKNNRARMTAAIEALAVELSLPADAGSFVDFVGEDGRAYRLTRSQQFIFNKKDAAASLLSDVKILSTLTSASPVERELIEALVLPMTEKRFVALPPDAVAVLAPFASFKAGPVKLEELGGTEADDARAKARRIRPLAMTATKAPPWGVTIRDDFDDAIRWAASPSISNPPGSTGLVAPIVSGTINTAAINPGTLSSGTVTSAFEAEAKYRKKLSDQTKATMERLIDEALKERVRYDSLNKKYVSMPPLFPKDKGDF